MRTKPHNYRPVAALAQLAGLAGRFPVLGRAYNNWAPLGRRAPRRGVHWHNANHRARVQLRERVGLACVVGAQVHSKAPFVRVPNPFNGFRRLFVRVGKPSAPKVSPDKLAKLRGVHLLALAWQVAPDVMAPDLLLWQARDSVA